MVLPPSYTIREGPGHTDFHRVHSWLHGSYWSPGVTLEEVFKAANGSSLVVNGYFGQEQTGYLRVVSDRATFAWLCDVWVAEEHRGKGLAKAMVAHALSHHDHQGLRKWVLATRNAHDIYASCGFELLVNPERWMVKF